LPAARARDGIEDLIGDLYAGLADQTYDTRLRKWAPTAAHMLFNLLDSRHEHALTVPPPCLAPILTGT